MTYVLSQDVTKTQSPSLISDMPASGNIPFILYFYEILAFWNNDNEGEAI